MVSGIIVQNGQPAAKTPTFQLERRDGRTPVGDVQIVSSSATDGKFNFDAGAILGLSFPNQALNLSDFDVVFRVGNGMTERMTDIRKQLTSSLDLGAIDISLISPAALITATGYVAGPLPASSPIAGATLWLIKGENQTVETLRQVRDTNVSRRLISGPDGRYTAANIETGTYTMLVSKPGFVDTYRGNTYIGANGIAPVVLGAVSSFVATGSMRIARVGHTATRLIDGRVLITGGDSSGNTAPYLRSAELYSPATGTFSPTGDMTSRRGSHTATLLSNGKVLITGGFTEYVTNRTLSSAEIYDPATGIFRAIGSMNIKRTWHTATPLNGGRVLVAGGFDNQVPIFGTYLSSAEVFDPNTETFSVVGGMTIPRIWFAATKLADGKVLIAGGSDGYGKWTSAAEIFNPSTMSFTNVQPMLTSRWILQSALMPNGQVLLPGGNVSSHTQHTNLSEVYSPISQSFLPVGAMSAARSGASVTALNAGAVLVAGGFNGAAFLDNAELYSVGTGTFSNVSTRMVSPRYQHTATLLNDGRVVLVGGIGSGNQVLSTAEVFTGDGSPSAVLSDDFIGSSGLSSSRWTVIDGSISTSGGFADVSCGSQATTRSKIEISGDSGIVVEARFAGTGANRSSGAYLTDANSAGRDNIAFGDTNYSAGNATPGMFVNGSGAFQTPRQFGSGNSVSAFKEYRFTVIDRTVRVERGNTLANIEEAFNVDLPTSVNGRRFFITFFSGSAPYCPGTTFDWIRASAR